MIYSTNRTASIGEIEVDVNESYLGAGYMNFMQESAQDELALFEMSIKVDIDEVLIGESADELEALSESFVGNAVDKIKEMVRKFIEWLKSVLRSAVAKLSQLLVRDNGQFCKIAERQLRTMKNRQKFEYSGKGLNFAKIVEFCDIDKLGKRIDDDKVEIDFDKLSTSGALSESELEAISKEIQDEMQKFEDINLKDEFNEECIEDVEGKGLDYVEAHLKFLKELDSKSLKKVKSKMKDAENKAKKKAKAAEKRASKYKEKDTEESKLEAKRLAVMAEATSAASKMIKTLVSDSLYIIKQSSKIARAVVAKAMGATPKNEAFEDMSEELVQAMIEAADFEYDEALEEMSEAKKVDDVDADDIEDDEE